MRVFKFGGTSVGSVENIRRVKELIDSSDRKIVVLSAMSGVTNKLEQISNFIERQNFEAASILCDELEESHIQVINSLISNEILSIKTKAYIIEIIKELRDLFEQPIHASFKSVILSKGELLSTYIFTCYLEESGINASLISALDFMRIDKTNEPDEFYIKQNLTRLLLENSGASIIITQGFICIDAYGNISNLQRGGSDYTATIIGGVINAEEVQIWTDIDGMHNNDPRYVENTNAISLLSYDEAAELAYFGAKILHPQTVLPARKSGIPVRLKNTMQPESEGTLISEFYEGEGIKAIAAKDGITALKIKSERMLLAHGFLKKVFEIFEQFETSIDMITTSEVAVSLTIDNNSRLEDITSHLSKFSTVDIDTNQSIICLVGHNVVKHHQTYQLFKILKDINVRMISYGGSNNNISILVNTVDKAKALQYLNRYLFTEVSVAQ